MLESGALHGIRVLDLGQFMAGPMAAMWLGDFGAEVIKVEHPRGDGFRHWGRTKDGHPLLWTMLSRNKECVTLNLSKPEGQQMLRDLVAQSDVLIENFTPGTLAKWGLAYEDLAKVNPRLVMLSISAYGQTGPYASRPGFGTLAEALSGYAHITGEADGPPMLPAFGLADSIAGLNGAYGIVVALMARQRTGRGQHIDCSLCEPLITLLGWQVVEYDQLGQIQGRAGSRLPFSAPRNTYRTKDQKYLAMSSSAQSVFERTMQAIGKPELITDERFIDNRKRGANVEELDAIIAEWIAGRTADEAMEIFIAHEAAAAPISDVSEVVADPQFQARKVVVPVDDQDLGSIRMQAPTPRLSDTPGRINFTGPHLGQHNRKIYGDLLGLDAAEVDRRAAAGII